MGGSMQRCKMRLLQSGVSDNPREGNSNSQGSDTQNFIPHIPLTCHSSRTPHRHSTKLGTHLSTPSPTPCPPAVHTNVCFSSSVPLGLSVWCWLSLAHWFYAALSMNSSNTSEEKSRKGPFFGGYRREESQNKPRASKKESSKTVDCGRSTQVGVGNLSLDLRPLLNGHARLDLRRRRFLPDRVFLAHGDRYKFSRLAERKTEE